MIFKQNNLGFYIAQDVPWDIDIKYYSPYTNSYAHPKEMVVYNLPPDNRTVGGPYSSMKIYLSSRGYTNLAYNGLEDYFLTEGQSNLMIYYFNAKVSISPPPSKDYTMVVITAKINGGFDGPHMYQESLNPYYYYGEPGTAQFENGKRSIRVFLLTHTERQAIRMNL